jgi:hypothetical protein
LSIGFLFFIFCNRIKKKLYFCGNILIFNVIKVNKTQNQNIMKKQILTLVALSIVIISASSCGSPYKKRKACRGNGSWYGNRNLGAVEQNNQQEIYKLTASIDK